MRATSAAGSFRATMRLFIGPEGSSSITERPLATSANDTARTAAKAALSAIADADVAKVAVDLSQQEAVYQAALYAASQAIQPSLLEFLK